MQQPNVIIMDEPTNHLDMESIESLNSALSQYEGTLLFASHDREFISSLATRVIELKPGKMLDHLRSGEEELSQINIDRQLLNKFIKELESYKYNYNLESMLPSYGLNAVLRYWFYTIPLNEKGIKKVSFALNLQEFKGQTYDAKPIMDLAAAEEKTDSDLLQGVFKIGQYKQSWLYVLSRNPKQGYIELY